MVVVVPSSQGRHISRRVQPAPGINTRRHSVDVLDAPTLDPEQVTVRHCLIRDGAVQPGEPHKQVHGPVLLVDNVAAVGDLDAAGQAADGAGLAGRVALAGVGAALEPRARRAPWDLDADVVETVEVGIAAGLDHGARVLLLDRDGIPVLDGVPVEVARGVEEPVALVGHDRLHMGDLAVVGVEYPRADDVRVLRVGHDELGEGGALDGVVDAACDVLDPCYVSQSDESGTGKTMKGKIGAYDCGRYSGTGSGCQSEHPRLRHSRCTADFQVNWSCSYKTSRVRGVDVQPKG